VRFGGKLYRRALKTSDYKLARHKVAEFRNDHDTYEKTLTGAGSTLEKKRAVIAKLRETWFGIGTLALRTVATSQVSAWLSKHYAEKSASYYDAALSVLRDALDLAVKDRIISESPAKDLTYNKRKKPVRLTPTFEQFKAIVASIRAQRFNREAEQKRRLYRVLRTGGTRAG
jgi:site-specific recombinase XerD